MTSQIFLKNLCSNRLKKKIIFLFCYNEKVWSYIKIKKHQLNYQLKVIKKGPKWKESPMRTFIAKVKLFLSSHDKRSKARSLNKIQGKNMQNSGDQRRNRSNYWLSFLLQKWFGMPFRLFPLVYRQKNIQRRKELPTAD